MDEQRGNNRYFGIKVNQLKIKTVAVDDCVFSQEKIQKLYLIYLFFSKFYVFIKFLLNFGIFLEFYLQKFL